MYYIIEHQTRGTFREMDYGWGGQPDKPRFSLTGSRADPDKAAQFRSMQHAIAMFSRIVITDPRMGRGPLKIRRSSDFKAWCQECRRWCDYWHEHGKNCSVYLDEVARHQR